MGRMASLPFSSRQPSIPRNVGTKQKRIIDSDDKGDVNKLYNLTTSLFNCFKLKNSAKIGQNIFVVAASQIAGFQLLGQVRDIAQQ